MSQIVLFLLLFAVFWWVYRGYSRYQNNEYSPRDFRRFTITKEAIERSELGLFVALVAKVAKADGRVDELEAELVGNMFNDISSLFPDPDAVKSILKEIFNAEKQLAHNVDEVAITLYALIRNDRHKQLQMFYFLVNLAFIDGTLSTSEESMLAKIASYFRFSTDEFSSILGQFGSQNRKSVKESSLDEAYALLGIDKNVTDGELKKAYRALVKQHHPDIIKAQGLDESYIRQATEKVQQINAAYELIKRSRGL
ncbi:MAG: DnaJ domain-containing protein [Sulfuricurvum sp.]